jgi:hypothetical protein
MRSLNEFKANLEKFGTVRQSRFDVMIIGYPESDLRCESVTIPGIQILTKDFQLYGGQPVVKIPNGRSTEEVQMTFLAMQDMRDRYFFEEWLHKISNFETNNVAYYNDVAATISISIYNEQSVTKSQVDSGLRGDVKPGTPKPLPKAEQTVNIVPVYTVQLVKAIPTRVEMMQASWADTDTLLKYSVGFSYESLKIESSANRSSQTFAHLDKVQK